MPFTQEFQSPAFFITAECIYSCEDALGLPAETRVEFGAETT